MIIRTASNSNGYCGLSFKYIYSTLENWFEVRISAIGFCIDGKYIKGHHEIYRFTTFKAAVNKFDELCEKHGIY